MPNCRDSQRARLVHSMAKRHSVAAVEAVLEKAVKYRDAEQIETATSMLQDILSTKITQSKDAFYSRKKGENLRYVECKPEDCPTCFWKEWCEMKENFDFLKEVDKTIKRSRELLRGSMHTREDKQKAERDARARAQIIPEARAVIADHARREAKGSVRTRRTRKVGLDSQGDPLTVGEYDPLNKKWVTKRENN